MTKSHSKTFFVFIVLVTALNSTDAQYVSPYNNSFTGPNLNRAKEEAYNRQMRDDQEKWRQKRYAEEAKAKRYPSYVPANTDTKTKTPVSVKPVTKTPEPKKSKWDYVSTYIDGLAAATLNGKSGYVDMNEQEIVPVIYDVVYLFWEGLSAVKLNGKYGYVDKKGKLVIPLKYDRGWAFEGGKASVVLNNKQTFINKNGVELLPFKYESLYAYTDGLIMAWLNQKMGFIDITGKEIIPVKYDSVTFLVEGGKKMFLDGLHYFFDKGGRPMKNVYDEVDDYYDDGTAFVSLNNKWGKTDAKGRLITPLKYDARPFTRYDMTEVRLNSKFGFINKAGKEVIRPQFDTIYRGYDLSGRAIVGSGNQMFSIDKTGKKIKRLTSIPEEKVE
ncbi:MAG: WG repeat-containing protein [Chitinophagaceae bacterium]